MSIQGRALSNQGFDRILGVIIGGTATTQEFLTDEKEKKL
jgi:hypothetical protein|tara:strand:+ start:594 stop:713 length:120 start_codon:yes stop_codon:yes gene_type:complete